MLVPLLLACAPAVGLDCDVVRENDLYGDVWGGYLPLDAEVTVMPTNGQGVLTNYDLDVTADGEPAAWSPSRSGEANPWFYVLLDPVRVGCAATATPKP